MLTTYPLNDVEYSAEDVELYNCTRESGVFAGDDFDVSVSGVDTMASINPGIGWIRPSRFSGKVIALTSAESVDMGVSDPVYPRIDAIVLQFDANKNATNVLVKQGSASSVPAAPEVVRTSAVYELHLYHVNRGAGSTVVTETDITDLRKDRKYCGLMADSVTNVGGTNAFENEIILKENIHYGYRLPEMVPGRLFFLDPESPDVESLVV